MMPHHRAEDVFQREPITLFLSLSLSLALYLSSSMERLPNGRWSQVYLKMEQGALREEAGIGLGDDLECSLSVDRSFEKLGNLGKLGVHFKI